MLGRGNEGTGDRGNGGMRKRSFTSFLRSRVPAFFRQLAGMPDYEGYLNHLRCSHPERAVPTEREYYAEYLRSRYGDGPTRCC